MVRFEWAQVVAFDGPSKPAISPDDVLDLPPNQLRLNLQPYLSLLELDYAVDDFLLAIKARESEVLRKEASNAMGSGPKAPKRRRALRLPAQQKVYLAVHRYDNQLYFKRLEPEAFAILSALARGETVEAACVMALEASERVDADWPTRLKEWFTHWSALGWFWRCP
jgi:hypothetical protein